MKITLILAASEDDPLRKNEPFMPLSLPLIAASCPDHDYTLVDMLSGEKPPYDSPADLVGISARATSEGTAYSVADEYRRRGIKVVLGGPQVSAVPHRARDHADAVVVGEGEPLWPVLLDHLAEGTMRDYYVCSPGPFDANGGSVFQIESHADLDRTPVAARHLFTKKKYVFDTVFAARGCNVNCSFCSVPGMFGQKTRLRPVADVVSEISAFKGMYYLLDDTVFGRPPSYDYYARLYDAVADLGPTKLWTGQANLDAAADERGREVIARAARAGLTYAAIGMESVDPRVLQASGALRKMGVKDPSEAISRMKDHITFIQEQGILISGWFVVGYDDDTIDSWYRALEFCEEMNVIPVISPLEALEGTPLWDELEAQGRIDNEKSINIAHPTLTDDQLLEAMRETTRRGFSIGKAISRTRFMGPHFSRLVRTLPKAERPRGKIERTIFAYVLQRKLRKGIVGFVNQY